MASSSKTPETDRMLKRIYRLLDKSSKVMNPISRANMLTGLTAKALEKIDTKVITELCTNGNQSINRTVVFQEWTRIVTIAKILPTTRQLFNILHDKIPTYVDIHGFRKQLVLMDFMWLHIPGYTMVVVERPIVTFERNQYLNHYLQRSPTMSTYFIDEIILDNHENFHCFYEVENKKITPLSIIMIAISRNNIIKAFVDDINEDEFQNFIYNHVLPALNEPSMVILNNAKHHCQKLGSPIPTLVSTKNDMMKWLNEKEIPYDCEMSKGVLHTIIKRCANQYSNAYIIDRMIIDRGHIVLRLPDSINLLSPTKYIPQILQGVIAAGQRGYDELFQKGPITKVYEEELDYCFKKISEETLNKFFDIVDNEKRDVQKIDLQIDLELDAIKESMRVLSKDEEDSDVPVFSDSE